MKTVLCKQYEFEDPKVQSTQFDMGPHVVLSTDDRFDDYLFMGKYI